MAIISKQTIGGKWILEVDQAPNTGAGINAPIGSEAYYSDGVNGFTFVKTGASDLDWVCDSDENFNVILLDEQTVEPTPPIAGSKVYSKSIGGRLMVKTVGPSGLDYTFQSHIGRNKTMLWQANGNATSLTVIGQAVTAQGTATTRNVANTNFFTWMRRLGYVSNSGAGSTCGIRSTALQYGRGNLPRVGGFHFMARFGISDASAVAGARTFVGLCSSTGVLTNADPSFFLNVIGLGNDSADTNMQIIHNDGSGVASKINLGASFPANTRNTDMYELVLFCAPNGSSVGYKVTNMTTGAEVDGELTTNIPLNTQLLAWQLWRSNNGTALAVGIDIVSVYMENDY